MSKKRILHVELDEEGKFLTEVGGANFIELVYMCMHSLYAIAKETWTDPDRVEYYIQNCINIAKEKE